METMSAHEAERKYHAARKTAPRRASATTLVAGLYVLLVLGAPLIVRYGPELAATPRARHRRRGITLRDGREERRRMPGGHPDRAVGAGALPNRWSAYTSTRSMPPAFAFAT